MSSSMYNSIHYFNEIGVKNIEKKIKSFISEGKDLGDLIFMLQEDLFELGRNIITEVLEDMDDYLRRSGVRKNKWEIVRKDKTRILTSFGNVEYARTYFKPKKAGKRKYLVDEIVGIQPHDRVSTDVVINAIEEASESSYRKAGETATYVDEISKQAVMNKIHNLEVKEQEIAVERKKEIKILYVEADEDHVPLQLKNVDKEENEKKRNIIMPRLVYVHEGFDSDKSTQKRKVLKNVRYFGGVYNNSEDLWIEVANYIEAQYDVDSIESIYLSGDGASWIKQGLNWLPKSKFVLDNYHLQKYIKKATAHLNDESIRQEVYDAIDWPDKAMLKKVFAKILKLTESETKQKAVKDCRKYIINNWDGIEIKAYKGDEIIGCSAEGHVSHVFSDRLSSRPRGWSKQGVKNMSKLIIYKKNGGKVYDLVMAQKIKELRESQRQIQDELIKKLRTEAQRYEGAWKSNVTVINIGKKTGLYQELKSKIG